MSELKEAPDDDAVLKPDLLSTRRKMGETRQGKTAPKEEGVPVIEPKEGLEMKKRAPSRQLYKALQKGLGKNNKNNGS